MNADDTYEETKVMIQQTDINGKTLRPDATTRLIAAAPELLRALKWMVLRAEEAGYPDGKCLEEAHAAIAKATGE